MLTLGGGVGAGRALVPGPAEAGERPRPGPRTALASLLERVPGAAGPEGRGSRLGAGHSVPILHFLAAFFSVHLMRNNNNDLKSNKRFNNFTNRLT